MPEISLKCFAKQQIGFYAYIFQPEVALTAPVASHRAPLPFPILCFILGGKRCRFTLRLAHRGADIVADRLAPEPRSAAACDPGVVQPSGR